VKGEWIAGISAGGSRNNLVDFATNPQFALTLTEPGNVLDAYITQFKNTITNEF